MKQLILAQPETGRSMVEMLGVLAVIGVLSVGGLVGYSYLIKRHLSNEILNDVTERATLMAAYIFTNGVNETGIEYDLGMNLRNTLNNEVRVVSQKDFFTVDVSDIQSDVCRHIMGMNLNIPIYVNDSEVPMENADSCLEGEVNLVFAFDNDGAGMGENCPSETSYWDISLGKCVACEESTYWNGRICAECADNSHCTHPAAPKCSNGECTGCVEDTGCPNGRPKCHVATGTCVKCITNADCNGGAEKGNYYCGNIDVNYENYDACEVSYLSAQCMSADKTCKTVLDGREWCANSGNMSWWDAQNFCAVIGMSPVSIDLLKQYREDLGALSADAWGLGLDNCKTEGIYDSSDQGIYFFNKTSGHGVMCRGENIRPDLTCLPTERKVVQGDKCVFR